MATFLVTGGAGFIGSNAARHLSSEGHDIVIADLFEKDDKWRNLHHLAPRDIITASQLPGWLASLDGGIDGIVHMGAVSATTERDINLIIETNFQLSKLVWQTATRLAIPLVYASSAAVYGDGKEGFSDDPELMPQLRPLNPYGWSKLVFDRWAVIEAEQGNAPPRWAGLRFFNVYGPGEGHKGSMRSLVHKSFFDISKGEPIRLFRDHAGRFGDGEQKRDFIYVRDCAAIIGWLLSSGTRNGIFNLGTGEARSWNDLARAVLALTPSPTSIEYIDMPEHLRAQYQDYTCSDQSSLKAAGWNGKPTSLEDGIADYISAHLLPGRVD
ncbi:ADP-glyceromanno-heptose 6-epimerase [Alphaproteobacteria bacterium LSUCC0684]